MMASGVESAATAGNGILFADCSERLAICASAACLVDCLVLPVLIVLLPPFSHLFAVPESFHLWALALAVTCAALALAIGCRQHGATTPLFLGCIGLGLLAGGALIAWETRWEVSLTVCGGYLLGSAHLLNWRLRHRHGCTCD